MIIIIVVVVVVVIIVISLVLDSLYGFVWPTVFGQVMFRLF